MRRLHAFHFAVVRHEGLPVGEACEAGKDVEGAWAHGGVALHVTPEPFQCGDTEVLIQPSLYFSRQEDKVVGGGDGMIRRLLHKLAQQGDILRIHGHGFKNFRPQK